MDGVYEELKCIHGTWLGLDESRVEGVHAPRTWGTGNLIMRDELNNPPLCMITISDECKQSWIADETYNCSH